MEKNRNENNRKNPLNKSFGYAFEGIRTGIRKERNMKIHCLAVIAVTVAGTFLHIKPVGSCIGDRRSDHRMHYFCSIFVRIDKIKEIVYYY